MAPTSSRLFRPLPSDLLIEIVSYLTIQDQRAILLSCWTVHDIVAPLLYRSIELWLQPSSWTTGSEERDYHPISLLAALARSARHVSTSYPTRCYPRYVRTLAYVSFSPQADLRALPILAEVLRFTSRLKHLRIEVDCESVALLLDVFSRRAVIRSPAPPVMARPSKNRAVALVLPSLLSIRSSRPAIVESLMRLRRITVAVLDAAPSLLVLNRILSSSGTPYLTHLSITLSVEDGRFPDTLRAIAGTFPRLVNFFVRTGASLAEPTLLHILHAFTEQPAMLPRVRAVAVNYGRLGLTYQEVLTTTAPAVEMAGERRAVLTAVALGMTALQRDREGEEWMVQPEVPENQWPWVSRRNQGAWDRFW